MSEVKKMEKDILSKILEETGYTLYLTGDDHYALFDGTRKVGHLQVSGGVFTARYIPTTAPDNCQTWETVYMRDKFTTVRRSLTENEEPPEQLVKAIETIAMRDRQELLRQDASGGE